MDPVSNGLDDARFFPFQLLVACAIASKQWIEIEKVICTNINTLE